MIGLFIFAGVLLGICIAAWGFTNEEKPKPLPSWHDIYDPSFDSSVKKKKDYSGGGATGILAAIFIFKR